MKTYAIKEIFGPTIQGEGSHAGTAVLFVRFAGCNRWSGRMEDRSKAVCWFCDTDFLGGERLSADQVVDKLKNLSPFVKTVVISGGEATLQLDLEFVKTLKQAGFSLHLETNGSKDIAELRSYFDHVTVSPKQAAEQTKIKDADDIKILYPPPIDGLHISQFESMGKNLFLQPVDGPDLSANTDLAIAFCHAHPQWRVSIQLHKILGVQ